MFFSLHYKVRQNLFIEWYVLNIHKYSKTLYVMYLILKTYLITCKLYNTN